MINRVKPDTIMVELCDQRHRKIAEEMRRAAAGEVQVQEDADNSGAGGASLPPLDMAKLVAQLAAALARGGDVAFLQLSPRSHPLFLNPSPFVSVRLPRSH